MAEAVQNPYEAYRQTREAMQLGAFAVDAPPAAAEEAARISEAQKVIELLIAQIGSSGLPEEEKNAAIDRLQRARSGGNLSVMSLAILMTRIEVPAAMESAEAQEKVAAYVASEYYPEYDSYSPESQKFMAMEMQEALNNSPEFRQVVERFEAMPPAEKESAKSEQRANYGLIKEMLNDDKFKDSHEMLRIFRSTGMAAGPEAQELLTKFRNGEITQDQFKEIVTRGVEKIAAQNDTFINDYMKKKEFPEQSRNALQAEFGNADGRIDSVKLTMEWGKIRLKDKDAAYKALAENNGDISKLNPEQQRIVHMAQVMIAAETKTVIEGAMGIIQRNQEVAKQLTDPTKSVEEKMAILDKEEKRLGIRASDPSYHREALKQAVLAINETVQEGGAYDPNKSGDFLKAVGANVKENYDELFAGKKELNNYQKLGFYAAYTKSDAAPKWYSEEQRAAYTSEWQKLEDRQREQYQFLEANGVSPAEVAASAAATKAGAPTSSIMSNEEYKETIAELKAQGMKLGGEAGTQVAASGAADASAQAASTDGTKTLSADSIPSVPAPVAAITVDPAVAEAVKASGINFAALGIKGDGRPVVGEPPSVVVATALQPQRNEGLAS